MFCSSANVIINHISFNVLCYVRSVVSKNQQLHSFFYFRMNSCNLLMNLIQKIDSQFFFSNIITCLLYLKKLFFRIHLLFCFSTWFWNFCNFILFLFIFKICITKKSSIIIEIIRILFRIFKILNLIKMIFSFWFFMSFSRIWRFNYSE